MRFHFYRSNQLLTNSAKSKAFVLNSIWRFVSSSLREKNNEEFKRSSRTEQYSVNCTLIPNVNPICNIYTLPTNTSIKPPAGSLSSPGNASQEVVQAQCFIVVKWFVIQPEIVELYFDSIFRNIRCIPRFL